MRSGRRNDSKDECKRRSLVVIEKGQSRLGFLCLSGKEEKGLDWVGFQCLCTAGSHHPNQASAAAPLGSAWRVRRLGSVNSRSSTWRLSWSARLIGSVSL